MKSTIQLVLAAILGGAIAFAGFKMFDKDTIIYQDEPVQVFETKATSAPTSTALGLDFSAAASKANPAVVHISAENQAHKNYSDRNNQYDPYRDFWGYRRQGDRPQAGTGSGVLISEDGIIVTNNHVVGFADYITVDLNDGTKAKAVKIGTDPSTDLAVIKIEGAGYPYLDFSDSDDVEVGNWVVAVGNPFNLTSTVTAGIVSAKGRDLNIIKGRKAIEEFIQTDAVVNPGNSGGALVDASGDLIGINTAISSPTGVYAGYSFAIPSNLVRRVVDEILETGGDIQRGMLGVQIAEVSQAKQSGVYTGRLEQGVFVADFMYDRYGRKTFSSAESAGIKVGDIITQVDNKKVSNFKELEDALRFAKIGDTLELEIERNGRNKIIPVKLRRGI